MNKIQKSILEKSKRTFESAFFARLGQSPSEYIESKLEDGNDLHAVKYAFDVTAAGVAQEYYCKAGSFEYYYKLENKEKIDAPKTTSYNKLVRDRVPEQINASGKMCKIVVLDDENYLHMLDEKLQEALDEYFEYHTLDDLAELLEVMGAIVKARGDTWDHLRDVRKEKLKKWGSFEKRLFLKEVIDE